MEESANEPVGVRVGVAVEVTKAPVGVGVGVEVREMVRGPAGEFVQAVISKDAPAKVKERTIKTLSFITTPLFQK